MNAPARIQWHILSLVGFLSAVAALAQSPAPQKPDPQKPDPEKKEDFKKGFFGPGGFGPFGQQRKLVAQFDKDGDRRLNAEERQAAREFIKKEMATKGKGGFGPRGPGGFALSLGGPRPARYRATC